MRRSDEAGAPWFIRLLRRAEEHFWEHWATDREYRRWFGSCTHRRHRDLSREEQSTALFIAWLIIVLEWLVYARITGQ